MRGARPIPMSLCDLADIGLITISLGLKVFSHAISTNYR